MLNHRKYSSGFINASSRFASVLLILFVIMASVFCGTLITSLAQGEDRPVKGTFGVCIDMKGKDFDYWIADLYLPWEDVPEGCETRIIPASLWAQFPCTIRTLQDTNTKIWSEWLPALQGYTLAGEYDIEVYLPPEEGSDDMKVYIWVPLKQA